MELQEQIIELEKSLLTHEVRSSKEELLKRIAQSFIEIGASGSHYDLNEVIEELVTEESWSAIATDFHFTQLSENFCRLIYKASIKHSKEVQATYSLRSSIWQKIKGNWMLVFHQGTKVEKFEFTP